MTQFALEVQQAALAEPARPAFSPTRKERDSIALAARIGLLFGGAKPTKKGFTLHFYAGCVGSIGQVLKMPRNSLGRRLMRLLASRSAQNFPATTKPNKKCHR